MSEEIDMDELVGNGKDIDFHKFTVRIGSLDTDQQLVRKKQEKKD